MNPLVDAAPCATAPSHGGGTMSATKRSCVGMAHGAIAAGQGCPPTTPGSLNAAFVISDFVDEMSLSLMTEAKKIMSKHKTITRIFIFKCKYVENALTCARSERLHGLRGPFPCA